VDLSASGPAAHEIQMFENFNDVCRTAWFQVPEEALPTKVALANRGRVLTRTLLIFGQQFRRPSPPTPR
jgi:hypothetical protein